MMPKSFKAGLVLAGLLRFTSAVGWAQAVVRIAPPAPQSVAIIGRAPGTRYVWTGGYWRWHGGRYVWVAGRWVVPPRVGVVWVAPRWVPSNGGYVFVAGRWQ